MAVVAGIGLIAFGALTSAGGEASATADAPPGSWQSLVRINAGGGDYTDAQGLTWSADEYFSGGSPHRVSKDIANTNDADLFQSERSGMSGYSIPIANGSYVLKLYFAEIDSSAGSRSMNVSANGKSLLSKFDVGAKVGAYTADQETFNVSVSNGKLGLSFSASENTASISAIEVLRVDALSVFRMNTGGGSYTDSRGLTWVGDQYEVGNKGSSSSTTQDIAGTNDAALYQSQRWGMSGYKIPIPNGSYVLKLFFAEINPSSGERDFDVSANSQQVLWDLDISATTGDYYALVEQFDVDVTGNSLNLTFTPHENQATIAGIEVLSPVAGDTSQDTGDAAASVVKRVTPTVAVDTPAAPAVAASADVAAPPATTTTTTAAPAPASNTSNVVTPSMTGWHMVASDDFGGSSIDKSKWGVYSGTGNEGVGWRSPSQVKVANGELQMLGQGDNGGGAAFNYSSEYGRYVIRMKDDAGTGYGPAVLLWPDSEAWPSGSEIDITEMPDGARTESYFTVHYGSDNRQTGSSASGDFTQWHTFTLDWMPDHITLWIDGVQQAKVTNYSAIPHDSMHLAIQNDVGASGHWIPGRNSSTPSTVTLHVSSVQVYQQN